MKKLIITEERLPSLHLRYANKHMLTPPPDTLNAAQILHSFGRLPGHQGEQDLLAGRVQLKAVTPAISGLEIKGTVALAEAPHRHYETSLYFQPSEEWILTGDCTCPAASDCQHCAALAYAWLRIKPAPVGNPLAIESWLKGLASAETVPPPIPSLSQWVYLLDFSPAPHTLGVKIALQERSNPQKPWRPFQVIEVQQLWPQRHHRIRTAVMQEDRDIFQILWSLAYGAVSPPAHGAAQSASQNATIPLKGKQGSIVLQDMLATGRCFWQQAPTFHQQKSLQAGAPRHATPAWRVVPGGQQWSIQLAPPLPPLSNAIHPPIFVLGATGVYYDEDKEEVGEIPLPAATLRQWLQAPVIPVAALAKVSQRLLSMPTSPPLPKGFELPEVIIHDVAPQPIFELLAAQNTALYFAYGQHHLEGAPVKNQVHTQMAADRQCVYRITRDLEREQSYRQQLMTSGLLPVDRAEHSFAFAHNAVHTPAQAEMALANQWHQWLHQHLPAFQKQGWKIQIHEAFRLQFITAPAWQGELLPDPKTHGFDLALGVNINGETVNLLPLLLRLLRTVPDLKAMREELHTREIWVLPLDPDPIENWAARSQHRQLPQRWLEIPTRRLMRILDILIELYDDVSVDRPGDDPERLKLSYFSALQFKSQVYMNPDDYGVEWHAPAALNTVIDRLRNAPQDGKPVAAPAGLQAELRPYQQRGLHWLSTLASIGLNGILADDMGLGKTLQTLALLLHEKAERRLVQPALILVPTSVLSTWEQEAQRFAPELRILRHHGRERSSDTSAFKNYDIVLTTYTLFRLDVLQHRQYTYQWLILDEAQTIKNPRSRTAQAACDQPSTHRLCLTGTPLENSLENLWSLFHFLMPGFLDTLERFNSRFRHPIEKTQDLHRLQMLKERIQPFVLRRLKQQVAPELPPKTEILRTVTLGNAQRDLYETLRLSVDSEVRKAISRNGFKQSRLFILDALLKLRQACCHPQLLKLPEAKKMRQSAKLEHLMELVPELLQSGRKILIFSQFVSMLRLIEERLQYRELPYALLTGETRDRDREIERFQSGEVPIFLISLKAGGVGLNLTQADTVIHYDPWWNPATEQQATDRSWRTGQTQPVFVYRLIAKGTIEERIVAIHQQKRSLQQGLLSNNGLSGGFSLEQMELLSLLQ